MGRNFLSNVRYVRLGDSRLATLTRQLQRLRGLEELRLRGGATTDSSLIQLKEFTNLRVLSLTGTGVTDAGLEHLEGLTSLESLGLRRTQVTDDGIDPVGRSAPACRFSLGKRPPA